MKRILLSLVLLAPLLCGGANIVTKTIQQSGGDYTSLAAWEAGRQTNCVAADSIETAVIQGSWTNADTSQLIISGWTTDSTRYIVITNSTSKHDGKRYGSAANAYRIELNNSDVIYVNEEFVRIYGIQARVINASAVRGIFTSSALSYPNELIFGNIIISGTSASGSGVGYGFYFVNSDANLKIFNVLCHGLVSADGTDGRFIRAQGTNYLYNCTGVGNRVDFQYASGVCVTYNCISQDSTSDGWTSASITGNYNCSDRASDAPGANSVNSYEVTFVSETGGSEDYHITSANTSIIDVTSDQSGGLFSNDIDETTRTGSWCIGADEYVGTSSSIFQVITSQ